MDDRPGALMPVPYKIETSESHFVEVPVEGSARKKSLARQQNAKIVWALPEFAVASVDVLTIASRVKSPFHQRE